MNYWIILVQFNKIIEITFQGGERRRPEILNFIFRSVRMNPGGYLKAQSENFAKNFIFIMFGIEISILMLQIQLKFEFNSNYSVLFYNYHSLL